MKKSKSIVTEYSGICFCCGRPATEEHHLLFGGSVRRLAEEDGIKVPCCPYCHTQNDVNMIIRWLRSYLKLPGSLRGKNMQ